MTEVNVVIQVKSQIPHKKTAVTRSKTGDGVCSYPGAFSACTAVCECFRSAITSPSQ